MPIVALPPIYKINGGHGVPAWGRSIDHQVITRAPGGTLGAWGRGMGRAGHL